MPELTDDQLVQMIRDIGLRRSERKPLRRRTDTGGLMTPAEVAAAFGVRVSTLRRWEKAGKLTAVRTLGGHRRYRADQVQALRTGAA